MPSFKRVEDLNSHLVHAFGLHVVQGTVVAKTSTAVGSEVQSYAVIWLGEGIWHRIVKAYWNGGELSSSDYHFHRGELSQNMDVATQRPDGTWTQGVDPWVQGGQTYSGTAYVVVKLPLGIKEDDDLSGLKFICECLMLPDYDNQGRQIDNTGTLVPNGATPEDYFFYSTNPARCMAYTLLFLRGLPNSRIDWQKWHDWKTFCDVSIPWVGGNVTGFAQYQNNNMFEGVDGGLSKANANNNWDSGAATVSSINSGMSGGFSTKIAQGYIGIGLTNNTSPRNANTDFSGLVLQFNPDGSVTIRRNGGAQSQGNFSTWVYGDEFGVYWDDGVGYRVIKNGQALTIPFTVDPPTFPLYGGVAAQTEGAEILTATMNPQTGNTERTRKRFECGLAFTNRTDIADVMNSILYISCSTVQDNEGKLIFLSPPMASAPRTNTFDFNADNILNIQVSRASKYQKFTHFPARFRNADSPVLKEDTVEITRDSLITSLGRANHAPEIWLGTITKGQAECVMSYYARLTDLDVSCNLTADATSYPVLPSDVGTVSDEFIDWENVRFWVISAKDNDHDTDQRDFVLQLYSDDLYSDTNQTPIVSDVVNTIPTPLTAPSIVSDVALTQVDRTLASGVPYTAVRGEVQFQPFSSTQNGSQYGRVWVKDPDDTEYRRTHIFLTPDPVTLQASFEFPAAPSGNWKFVVVTESVFGVSLPFVDHPEFQITITSTTGDVGGESFVLIDQDTPSFTVSVLSRSNPSLTANRTFTINVKNGNRNLNFGGDFSIDNNVTFSGDFASTLNLTGVTNITLPTSGTLATVSYVDSLVVGLLDDRGSYNASGNVFPSTGGSGAGGTILKGDIWYISVAGTLGGNAVNVGDSVRALVDSPGQTASNWSILESNIGYVPENVANKATNFSTINNTLYPTTQAVSNLVTGSYQPLDDDLTEIAAISNVRGDLLVTNSTPSWTRLALSVPAANSLNVLGVANGELDPSWKTVLDSTNPVTLGVSIPAAPGTAVVFAHRDHVHAITTSSNPGGSASILASDASGYLTLLRLTLTDYLFVNAPTANIYIKDTNTGFQSSSSTVITPQANNSLRSTSFTSGLVGWGINAAGDAEFANVTVRGALRSSILLYNAVLTTAGTQLVVPSAGKLRSDVVIPTSPTYNSTTVNIDIVDQEGLSHGASQLFAVNDILFLKDGLTGYGWFKVTSVSDQTTFWRYTCTIQAGTANVTYRAGLGVADYKTSGFGGIMSTADQANAPYIQMFTHDGTFSANSSTGTLNVTPQLRIGNLNGSYGYATDVFGFGTGQYGVASKAWVTVEQTNGIRLGINATTRISLSPSGILSIIDGSLQMSGTGYLGIGSTVPTIFLGGSGIWLGMSSGTAKMHVGTTTPTVVQPNEISGLKLWFKANSLSLNDGDAVGTWTDLSGNGWNATQSTAANKPTFKTNILNGKAVVRFDGTDDFISRVQTITHGTVFIVLNFNSGGNFPNYAGAYITNSGAGAEDAWVQGNSGTTNIYDSSQTHYVNGTATQAFSPLTTFKIVCSLISPVSRTSFVIGNDPAAGGRYWNGDIAEIIVFDTQLSDNDRRKIETYLGNEYNISVATQVFSNTQILSKGLSWDGSNLEVKGTNFVLNATSNYLSMGTSPPTSFGNNVGVFIEGANNGRVSLYKDANNYLQWDSSKLLIKAANFTLDASGNITATNATLSGTISAISGDVGGFNIGSDYIRDTVNSFGLASTVTGGDDIRFWAGSTFANRATAAFRLYESGALTATNAILSGSLTAGGGNVLIDSSGIGITADAANFSLQKSIHWTGSNVGTLGIWGVSNSGYSYIYGLALGKGDGGGDTKARIQLLASNNQGTTGGVTFLMEDIATTSYFSLSGDNTNNSFKGVRITDKAPATPAAFLDVDVVSGHQDLMHLRVGSSVLLSVSPTGILSIGSGPTTITDSVGKILSSALNTVQIAQGGTGSITASGARTNLGLGTTDTPQFARIGLGQVADSSAVLAATGQYYSTIFPAGNTGTALTLDWNNGNVQSCTATGNVTFTLSNPKAGARYLLIVTQDNTGSRTYTWPASVKWSGGSVPTSSGANKVDIFAFVWDGSSYYGSSILNF